MNADPLLVPIRLGPLELRNRIVAPPHAAMLGNLFGSSKEAERCVAYWRALAESGTAMLTAINGFVENILPPGFDATGVGARKAGNFRHPLFVERMGYLAREVQRHGAKAGTQLIVQGGTPHGPSSVQSGPVVNTVPHAITLKEIDFFVEEYRASARQAALAGLDAVELHANHDDLIEWFLSPLTNQRDDAFGGDHERRFEFLKRILFDLKSEVGGRLVIPPQGWGIEK